MMTRIKDIIRMPLVRNTLKLSSSSLILMFLPLLVTPILSRLYTPADYGDWGVFSSVLYIVSAFVFLSYENTIVKTDDEREIPILITLCLLALFFVSLGVFVVFKGGALLGFDFFVSFPCFPLLIPIIVFAGLYTLSTNIANREKKYNSMAASSIVQGVTQAVLRIILGVYPIISYGLIVGNLVAQALATTVLIISLGKFVSNYGFNSVSWQSVKLAAVKYRKFPLFDAPARFIEFAIGNLAIIILAQFWTKEDIGCFSMVTQFVLIPITIIGSAMGNVYYREISENYNDKEALSRATTRVGKISFVLSVMPILFLSLGGDRLFAMFLGGKWDNVAPMSLCMVLFSVPVILSEPLLPIFRTLERQEIRFRINAVNFILALGMLIFMAIFTHNLYLSITIYSLVYAILRFIMLHNELTLSGLKVRNLSKWFVIIIILCYCLAFIRIIPYII